MELLVFLEIDSGSLHRSYCVWVSTDLRFIADSYFLFKPQGHFFYLFKKKRGLSGTDCPEKPQMPNPGGVQSDWIGLWAA